MSSVQMRALVMAGGVGTRLWPLSTAERPKQFLPLLSDKSLLAETYERLIPLTEDIFVATAERHADLVLAELKALPADHILLEPARRNSGPALLSAAIAFERDGDPVTAAIPSDQTVADPDAFRRALSAAARAADAASAVVLAVPPSRPDTDYGYLEVSEDAAGDGLTVSRFIEKPGREDAEACVQAGYYWNAGIFVFRPSRFLSEARRVAAPLVEKVERYREKLRERDEDAARRAWEEMPSVSIDYAVMEKASRVRAVPLRAGWSDVGTWRSVRELRGPTDEHGNLILSKARVVAPGVRDTAIVVSDDGVLVLPFERENELRSSVERAQRRDPAEKPV
jgi:mannose-1-phosphate guanylyltransferase/mannose-6-phosphate isomerase